MVPQKYGPWNNQAECISGGCNTESNFFFEPEVDYCCEATEEWYEGRVGNGITTGWICGECFTDLDLEFGTRKQTSVVSYEGKCYRCTGVNASGADNELPPSRQWGWAECPCCEWWCKDSPGNLQDPVGSNISCTPSKPGEIQNFGYEYMFITGGYWLNKNWCETECKEYVGQGQPGVGAFEQENPT